MMVSSPPDVFFPEITLITHKTIFIALGHASLSLIAHGGEGISEPGAVPVGTQEPLRLRSRGPPTRVSFKSKGTNNTVWTCTHTCNRCVRGPPRDKNNNIIPVTGILEN